MTWDYAEIVALAGTALQREAHRLELEQATRGVDALTELAIHPLIRAGLSIGPYTVLSEQRYPPGRSRKNRAEGERCDIVLIDQPSEPGRAAPTFDHLLDPLASGTLFGDRGADPLEALWIEVKVVHQFHLFDGGVRANPAYSSMLLREATADVRKLAKEPGIGAAAMLLVMFAESLDTGAHDLKVWRDRCALRGLATSAPFGHRFPIADRLGNRACAVELVPVPRGFA
jgi:hypothetical protein